MSLSFDIISDLYLTTNSVFDWNDKPTSLFCLVAGNISTNIFVVQKTLRHLSTIYHGVFYIDGSLENSEVINRDNRVEEISKICFAIPKVVYLHNNVVVLEGVAILGLNGWYKNHEHTSISNDFQYKSYRYEDISYLSNTIGKLQLHVDVRKIVIVSNSIPDDSLYLGDSPNSEDDISPAYGLGKDTEHKIKTWVFGTYDKEINTVINNINYVNNPCYDKKPYYPKRIEI
jgi:predicted phosphohydrolase